jgi:hypothetical protein
MELSHLGGDRRQIALAGRSALVDAMRDALGG